MYATAEFQGQINKKKISMGLMAASSMDKCCVIYNKNCCYYFPLSSIKKRICKDAFRSETSGLSQSSPLVVVMLKRILLTYDCCINLNHISPVETSRELGMY
jgi:hypothetical protein